MITKTFSEDLADIAVPVGGIVRIVSAFVKCQGHATLTVALNRGSKRGWARSLRTRDGGVISVSIGPRQSSFFHGCEEDWHQKEDVNRRGDHASYDWRGDWLHHVGADTALP